MKQSTHSPEPRIPAGDNQLLDRIAAALGVPVEAFFVLPEQLVFHIAPDGMRWFLSNNNPGLPSVRCVGSHPSDQDSTEEGVATFLAKNLDNPQGKALAEVIDRILAMHFHLGMHG